MRNGIFSLPWFGLALVIILLDQYTKSLASNGLEYAQPVHVFWWLNFTLQHNAGAAFSFLSDAGGWQRWFFIVLGAGFCIYILWEMRRLRPSEKMLACVYALILGGALGNLWGRMVNGYVVDFILVHYQDYIFPAFNVADSALFCGVALWMVLIFREYRVEE